VIRTQGETPSQIVGRFLSPTEIRGINLLPNVKPPDIPLAFSQNSRHSPNSTYRKNSFASIGVNPLNGYLYMIYADQPGASSQVEFTMSTDGGKTFSAAAAINDSPDGQRFFTALAVDSAGNLHASWFDTRNSAGKTTLYDVYASFSKDCGLTFANNASHRRARRCRHYQFHRRLLRCRWLRASGVDQRGR
jgi:hypothetical protein